MSTENPKFCWLDYADQRYYSSALGRFMTSDTYRPSVPRKSPGGWNRYSYTHGDPINRVDPRGLDDGDDPSLDCDDSCLGGDPGDSGGDPFADPGSGAGGCSPFDASCGNPNSCTGPDGVTPIPGPLCPVIPGVPAPTPVAQTVVPQYLLITLDCYQVPTNGGPVTREIDYQVYGSDGNPYSFGTVWEHLTGDIPYSGPNSPSSGPPGTFDDEQSVLNFSGIKRMHVTQTFTDNLSNGAVVPLFVRGFGGDFGTLDIVKTNNVIYINGNAGGQVDPKTGKLIPGTYMPCN